MDEAPPRPASRWSGSATLFWSTWSLGPACYGLAFGYCTAWPERCSDPPNVLLACCLSITHFHAGLGTLVLLVASGWRQVECWLLLVYWLAIAGWLFAPQSFTMADVRMCMRAAAALVVLVPVARLLRQALGRRNARRLSSG